MQKLLTIYFCLALAVLAGRLCAQYMPNLGEAEVLTEAAAVYEEQDSSDSQRSRGGKRCLRQIVKIVALEARVVGVLRTANRSPKPALVISSAETFDHLFRRSGHAQLFQKS